MTLNTTETTLRTKNTIFWNITLYRRLKNINSDLHSSDSITTDPSSECAWQKRRALESSSQNVMRAKRKPLVFKSGPITSWLSLEVAYLYYTSCTGKSHCWILQKVGHLPRTDTANLPRRLQVLKIIEGKNSPMLLYCFHFIWRWINYICASCTSRHCSNTIILLSTVFDTDPIWLEQPK